ncbi:helix-turn-helix domain-containing protein [Enterococcus faecalis]
MVEIRKKSYYPIVPIPIILSAIEEDPISIKIILKHYYSYMASLCLSNGFNETGKSIIYVDEIMLRQLETKLIEAILKFKIKK